jgi:hypothetical protein
MMRVNLLVRVIALLSTYESLVRGDEETKENQKQ